MAVVMKKVDMERSVERRRVAVTVPEAQHAYTRCFQIDLVDDAIDAEREHFMRIRMPPAFEAATTAGAGRIAQLGFSEVREVGKVFVAPPRFALPVPVTLDREQVGFGGSRDDYAERRWRHRSSKRSRTSSMVKTRPAATSASASSSARSSRASS